MTANSYYQIIENCINGGYNDNDDIDRETIKNFLIRQTDLDVSIGDLFLQEAMDLRNFIITKLT